MNDEMRESDADDTSLLGTAEFEQWINETENEGVIQLEAETDDSSDQPNLDTSRPHPLLISIVLEKVFTYLDGSSERSDSLKSQRRVCRTWNVELIRKLSTPHTCRSSNDIRNLLDLVSNPLSPSPFLRSLSLRYNELWKNPETFQLLWSVQDHLKILEIAAIELEYCPLMLLPKVCPSLQKLKLSCTDFYPNVDWDRLEPFQDHWNKPFPSLRELEIHRGSLTMASVKLIMALLERVHSLDIVKIQVDTGFGRDDGIKLFGEELNRRPKILRRLKRLNLESYNCDGFMTGVTGQLRPPFCVNLQNFSLVQKSGTLFPPISVAHLEKALSALVQECSHTLKHLTIVNSSESPVVAELPVGKILFPETMPVLEFLCLGNVGFTLMKKKKGPKTARIQETERELRGFSTLFPNLTHFEFWVRIFNDITDDDKAVLFETMFPQDKCQPGDPDDLSEPQPETNHKYLRDFHIYTRLKPCHARVLEKISSKFQFLQSLMLELDGELLTRVVHLFKDLAISQFTLIYYETENGMPEFDSATTGVSMMDCTQFVLESEVNHDYLDMDKIDKFKTKASFVDWKCLTRFNVSYRHGGVCDVVFLTFCLRLMKPLKHLELRHFDIKENLLIRLIKKTELETLVLGNCRVIPMDEDYPVIGHNFGIEDLVAKYKKGVKVNFVGYEGTSDESTPYYAQLLNHFDYDNYVAGNY